MAKKVNPKCIRDFAIVFFCSTLFSCSPTTIFGQRDFLIKGVYLEYINGEPLLWMHRSDDGGLCCAVPCSHVGYSTYRLSWVAKIVSNGVEINVGMTGQHGNDSFFVIEPGAGGEYKDYIIKWFVSILNFESYIKLKYGSSSQSIVKNYL